MWCVLRVIVKQCDYGSSLLQCIVTDFDFCVQKPVKYIFVSILSYWCLPIHELSLDAVLTDMKYTCGIVNLPWFEFGLTIIQKPMVFKLNCQFIGQITSWKLLSLCCSLHSQGRRKRGGRGGLSHPTFFVHSVKSAIEDKRVDSQWQCSRSRWMLSELATAVCSINAARC